MGKIDEANLIRIRNNQRRSRARHKEYVASLENRVRLSELQSVEANFEMQQAAKKVAEENKKIRNLLHTLGYDNEKITNFLETGNLDVADAKTPRSSCEQENLDRTFDFLLQQTHLSTFDYDTLASASSSSEPSNIWYNGISSGAADPSRGNRGQPQAHVVEADGYIQPHNTAAATGLTLGLGVQGLSQCSVSNTPPIYPLAEPTQQPSTIFYSTGESRLLDSVKYTTDLDFQDSIYRGRKSGKLHHHEDENMMGSHSVLSSVMGDGDSSVSTANAYQSSQYQKYMRSGYGQYVDGMSLM